MDPDAWLIQEEEMSLFPSRESITSGANNPLRLGRTVGQIPTPGKDFYFYFKNSYLQQEIYLETWGIVQDLKPLAVFVRKFHVVAQREFREIELTFPRHQGLAVNSSFEI